MTRLNLYSIMLLGLALISLTDCERIKDPLGSYVGEFRVGDYTFPIAVRAINGVEVRYVIGLVNFTTNPDVTIEDLQPLVQGFNGEILESWQPTGSKELDILMRIPLALDPFEVADQLNRSPLVRSAEPVFVSPPEGP